MTSRKRPIVAIDGPAGAGKSTVARRLAEALGFVMVDTGALYRTVALAATRGSLNLDDGPRVADLTRALVARQAIGFEREAQRGLVVRLDGEDVSDAIRTREIGQAASRVSAHGDVRAALLDLQRMAGREGGVVLEGRDIGTVVFPDAEVKFFLTASDEVRARRRYEELVARGTQVSLDEVLADVRERDAQDERRAVAPLKAAPSAILVDSSARTIDDTVAFMADRVREIPPR